MAALAAKVIAEDVERYGNQHNQFVEDPIGELQYGLQILEENKVYEARFNQHVIPMVYGNALVTWQDAFQVFRRLAENVLAVVDENCA